MDFHLYNGSVTLEFDEKEHLYRYNGAVVPSVTSIIGVIDKPYLTPWALKMAQGFLNEKIKLKNLSVYSMSKEITPNEVALWAEEMKTAHKKKFKEAGSIGTEVHEWIEKYIKSKIGTFAGTPIPPSVPEVEQAVRAFLEWESVNDVEYLLSESKVFSVKHVFAGTLDVVAMVSGVKTLLDFKTSNSYSNDYDLQTAAYVLAHNEEQENGVEHIFDRVVIMLSKESGMPTPYKLDINKYESEVEVFLAAKRVYDWKQTLPKFEYSKKR